MKKYTGLVFSIALLLLIGTARADVAVLPFDQNSFNKIISQRQNKPFILAFWSTTCGYCIKELALFGKLHKRYPEVELVIVATDPFLDPAIVKDTLNRSQLELKQTWVFAEQFPDKIYYKINKRWRGELPATHFFGRDNKEIRYLGVVQEAALVKWLDEQTVRSNG